MMKYIISLFLTNIFLINSFAQSNSEIDRMRHVDVASSFQEKYYKFSIPGFQPENPATNQTSKNFYKLSGDNKNEFQFLFSGLFLFYKFFFSSQDVVSCAFSPSCSEYGILSVKKQGALLGTISTFDRLMRCHGLSSEKYQIDEKSGLLIDHP